MDYSAKSTPKTMTFHQLLMAIQAMPQDRLNETVKIYCPDMRKTDEHDRPLNHVNVPVRPFFLILYGSEHVNSEINKPVISSMSGSVSEDFIIGRISLQDFPDYK
jgi:hypothetical protein